MKIPVILVNGSLRLLSCEELDAMLEVRVVAAFQRISGWVVVGRDAVRRGRGDGRGSWRDRKVLLPFKGRGGVVLIDLKAS